MSISEKDVERLAALSKMQLTPDELKKIHGELSSIFDFVEQLNSVDADDKEPTSQVTGLENVVRSDQHVADYTKEEMVSTMPDVDDDGHLSVHAVFTGDSPSN